MPRKRRQPRRRRARLDVEALLAAIDDGVPYDIPANKRHYRVADLLRELAFGWCFFPHDLGPVDEARKAVGDRLREATISRYGKWPVTSSEVSRVRRIEQGRPWPGDE